MNPRGCVAAVILAAVGAGVGFLNGGSTSDGRFNGSFIGLIFGVAVGIAAMILEDRLTHRIAYRLLQSVRRGDMTKLRQLLLEDAPPDSAPGSGQTALQLASELGNGDALRLLLQQRADPNAADRDGRTPLHLAAQKGNAEIVQLLGAAGADANKPASDGTTALFIAANVHVVRALLTAGADPHAATPTRFAYVGVHLGFAEIARLLVVRRLPGSYTTQTKDGREEVAILGASTPLHFAVQEGREDVVNALLQIGAPPDAADACGLTPLHLAPNERIANMLLAAGASGAVKGCGDITPLHMAVLARRPDVAACLIAARADVNAKLELLPNELAYAWVVLTHRGTGPALVPLLRAQDASTIEVVSRRCESPSRLRAYMLDIMEGKAHSSQDLPAPEVRAANAFLLCHPDLAQAATLKTLWA